MLQGIRLGLPRALSGGNQLSGNRRDSRGLLTHAMGFFNRFTNPRERFIQVEVDRLRLPEAFQHGTVRFVLPADGSFD